MNRETGFGTSEWTASDLQLRELQAENDRLSSELNDCLREKREIAQENRRLSDELSRISSSRLWKWSKPVRRLFEGAARAGALCLRGAGLLGKTLKNIRKYGVRKTFSQIELFLHTKTKKSREQYARQLEHAGSRMKELESWIGRAPHPYILLSLSAAEGDIPAPGGPETDPAGESGAEGLFLYGCAPGSSGTDVYRILSPSSALVDLRDSLTAERFWEMLDKWSGLKLILLSPRDEEADPDFAESLMERGYHIVFAYTDEAAGEERWGQLLADGRVTVAVSSEELLEKVRAVRDGKILLTGGRLEDCAGQIAEQIKTERKDKTAAERELPALNPALDSQSRDRYIRQVLNAPRYYDEGQFAPITSQPYVRRDGDAKVIAYYLTQYHPDAHNEQWWGRGITEWNNVCRAVPQFPGHYQPRLPGELGFYDLRLADNMKRQIELAKMYGVYGFSFYYYWFDGERLLEKPLEMFLEHPELDMPFSLCWANENWTKRYDGTSRDVLIEQPKTRESYENVITDMARFLRDSRYITVDGRKLLTVYRPSFVPDAEKVLAHWREYCRRSGLGELYLIAVKEMDNDQDWLAEGFDAVSEFHPGTIYRQCLKIDQDIPFLREDFSGEVFSYKDIVINKKYFRYDHPKLYRAVMPMWDNTARRDNAGTIFHGSTPLLYKRWLKDVIKAGKERNDIEDNLIFVNAWNEWGEGAYLEPDKRFGYAYLEATKQAVEECR